nr:hypothetical protein CFP56_04941 [Quercus suber]
MESKTFKGKALQEGKMDTANEKILMQKMLECVEVQAEVLKKIIGHLSDIAKEEAEKDKANRGLEEEVDDEMVSCWSGDNGNWFFDQGERLS